jgi:response regulator RpfG family c-di-GMP phosphodiesterase
MPKVSGLEVLKIVKADRELRTIPVVALTSSRETSDLNDFYEQGVNAYVVKPVDFSEFMKAVKHVGIFWAMINESPLHRPAKEDPVQSATSGRKEDGNEDPAPYPAPRG